MTDTKQLLENAAKAAGHVVDLEISTDDWLYIDPDENGDQMPWNPLTDDGDALRLAVKLYFNIKHFPPGEDADDVYPGMVEIWQEDGLRHVRDSNPVLHQISANELESNQPVTLPHGLFIGGRR